MNYKEDKRTKNLSLHDIHVGDWVQAWDDITKRYTPPERITAIFDDGTVYTEIDPEQGDPFEYDISEIDGLPITSELLLGFGFEIKSNICFYGDPISLVVITDLGLGNNRVVYIDRSNDSVYLDGITYMYELQQAIRKASDYIGTFNPQWKGV